MTPRAGTCRTCARETGNVAIHERYCRPKPSDALVERCGTHAMPEWDLRPAQRLQGGVTELDVARVMLELERGVRLYLNRMGRWCAPTGSRLGNKVSPTVHEMIRTGLVRHYKDREGDHLVPAKVHLDLGDRQSACKFVGEDLGPMRSRLTMNLDLCDCSDCCEVVATGEVRAGWRAVL
jgi:hypothetical protein